MRNANCLAMLCATGMAGVVLGAGSASADTIKTLHIKMPSVPATRGGANDMHVTFFGAVEQAPKGTQPGRTDDPSDIFDGISGIGTNTANFASGNLTPGSTDNFNIGIDGNPAGDPFAFNIVTQVVFTKDGLPIYTLDQTTAEKKKEFKLNVTGFTNKEYIDYSNPSNARLLLFNDDASLNLRYTLHDFKVFRDLDRSNFNIDNFTDSSSGPLIFSSSELVVNPGEIADISLGSFLRGSYTLAQITTLTVEDLDDGSMQTYSVPQYYAQTAPIPEAATWVLMLTGFGLLGGALRCRRSLAMPAKGLSAAASSPAD